MSDTKIAVRICGTVAAFESIAVLNNPQFPPLEHRGIPGADTSAPYYLLHIDEKYAQYTVVMENVRPAGGAHSGGILKISISLPKGFTIVDSSPYKVLGTIRDTFVRRHMVCIEGIYHFASDIPTEVVENEVQQALTKFKLAPFNSPWRPMTGKNVALLCCPASKMELLMKDIQYPEFASYKEILVAETHKAFNGDDLTRRLEVPRWPMWKVAVNEKRYVVPPGGLHLSVCKALNINPDCFEDTQVTFREMDILKGALPPHTKLDIQNETVWWNPPKTVRPELLPSSVLISTKIVITDITKSLQILYNDKWVIYQKDIQSDGGLKVRVRYGANILQQIKPVNFSSKQDKVEVSLPADWLSLLTVELPQLKKSTSVIIKNGKPSELRLDAFTSPMEKESGKGNRLIQWIMFFVAGACVSALLFLLLGHVHDTTTSELESKKEEPIVYRAPAQDPDILKKIESYKKTLASNDLTFVEVDNIYLHYNDYKDIDKEFASMVMEYVAITGTITSNCNYHVFASKIGIDAGTLKPGFSSRIHQNHLDMMRKPFLITSGVHAKAVDQAVRKYNNHEERSRIKSFKDFEILLQPTKPTTNNSTASPKISKSDWSQG